MVIIILLLNVILFGVITKFFPEIATCTDTKTLILATLVYVFVSALIVFLSQVVCLLVLSFCASHGNALGVFLSFIACLACSVIGTIMALNFVDGIFEGFVINPEKKLILAIICVVFNSLCSVQKSES